MENSISGYADSTGRNKPWHMDIIQPWMSCLQASPDYLGIAWRWISEKLGDLMTDKWSHTMSEDANGRVVVSGTLIDRTGEGRTFSVLITKGGVVIHHQSDVSPKQRS